MMHGASGNESVVKLEKELEVLVARIHVYVCVCRSIWHHKCNRATHTKTIKA